MCKYVVNLKCNVKNGEWDREGKLCNFVDSLCFF